MAKTPEVAVCHWAEGRERSKVQSPKSLQCGERRATSELGERREEREERRMQSEERGAGSAERCEMLAGARADYVGRVVLIYGLLTQGGAR